MMELQRPFDLLDGAKGKRVLVHLKSQREIVGTLVTFDMHINMVLEDADEMENGETRRKLGNVFIRGDTVVFVSPA